MRRKLERFPEVKLDRIDLKAGRAYLRAEPSFYQYVALEHAVEEAGGAIQMVHPKYLVPQAYHATLGVREQDLDKISRLEEKLKAIPGVRVAVIDPQRWFTNEKGIDVGGAVIFADSNPRLVPRMTQAAQDAGFILELKDHGPEQIDEKEWSEMNHAFAGLCMLFLTVCGFLQVGLKRPPWMVRYGTAFVWLALFVFLFIRADRDAWPLGPISWWESWKDWDNAAHRIGVGLILLIAIGDFMRLRKGIAVNPALGRWAVLGIGTVGSVMLFTHLHSTLDPAHYQQVVRMNIQHLMMATCTALFTLSKFAWDTWQVPRKWGQYLWLIFLGCLGIVLTLYVE